MHNDGEGCNSPHHCLGIPCAGGGQALISVVNLVAKEVLVRSCTLVFIVGRRVDGIERKKNKIRGAERKAPVDSSSEYPRSCFNIRAAGSKLPRRCLRTTTSSVSAVARSGLIHVLHDSIHLHLSKRITCMALAHHPTMKTLCSSISHSSFRDGHHDFDRSSV